MFDRKPEAIRTSRRTDQGGGKRRAGIVARLGLCASIGECLERNTRRPLENPEHCVRQVYGSAFRIITIKLDDRDVPEWWRQFLYTEWNSSDQPGSIIRVVESLLGRKIYPGITGAAFLTSVPASVFTNQSASLAEHPRNYILYYIAHVTGLLRAVTEAGVAAEHQDTITKLLNLSLLNQLPTFQGGWMPCAPGQYEFIHANRMRCPPHISIQDLPSHYEYKIIHNDEVSTRISFHERATKKLVVTPVPFSATFNSRL